MTNYRMEINDDEKDMFSYCFSCGAKLISKLNEFDLDSKEDYVDFLVCSRDAIHLKIWVLPRDEDTYANFI